MIRMKFKKAASLLMVFALTMTLLPATILQVKAADNTATVFYSNDFEDASKLPSGKPAEDLTADVNGSKAVKYNYAFDSSSGWDQKADIEIAANYAEIVPAGTKLKVDLLLPANSTYTGVIKVKGAIKLGDAWTWTEGSSIPEVGISDFTAAGGYLLKTVEIPFPDQSLTDPNKKGLHQIVFQFAGGQCNYNGNVYIDNVSLEKPIVTTVLYNNDFEDASKLPSGKPAEDLIADVNGSKAVKYNYAFDSGSGWDQKADIEIAANYAEILPAGTKLKVDLLLPANSSYTGVIKVKGAIKLGNAWTWTEGSTIPEVGISDFTAAGGYMLKTVEIPFSDGSLTAPDKIGLHQIVFQFAGGQCNYNGNVYIDNVKLVNTADPNANKYVAKTAAVTPQAKIEPSKLTVPGSINLVDPNASSNTAKLYAYLRGIGASDYVIYGHQNDTHHKAVLKDSGTNSDSKDITGSISGLVAIDGLSLTGDELKLASGETDLVTKAANVSIDAAKEGAVISLSAHMPNFDLVAQKGKNDQGKYDYSVYTTGTTTGNVVSRIMPGGDLNEVFRGYLDMVADYGRQLDAKGVPVLFRPFHENNGSWFWWGAAYCDPAAFKNLYRYTVEYLRDTKHVHNFLYVYSPNGPFGKEEEYLSRYPGDEYIDVMGFDMYHDNPTTDDTWITSLKDTIKVVDGIAVKHKKLSALSEVGIRPMKVTNNPRPDWYKEVMDALSGSNMAYYMTWSNWGENEFYEPYMVSDTKGHELINKFIDFYNEENSVFANGIGDYRTISVTNGKASATGYFTAPVSGSRILEPTTVKASVKNEAAAVTFVLKNSKGESVSTLTAVKGDALYSAQITQADLNKLGATAGSIELNIGGKVYDKISALFNIQEEPKNPAVVDTFETYYGESALVKTKWTTNAGPGCSIEPALSTESSQRYSGDYGLAFNYTITGKTASEGWAGITKAAEADWSAFDALSLWIKPDGKGQKLVIQITSNQEDFEVHMPEFAATTEAKLWTIPFSQFVGKKKGTFDPSKIQKVGLWCNTIVPEGQTSITVNSIMYFDDIRAVNTKAATITGIDNITANVEVGKPYTLPAEVTAKYSDNTTKAVKVTWNPSTVDTSKTGTFTFQGTVDGYDGKVTLTLTVLDKLPKTGSPIDNKVLETFGLLFIISGLAVMVKNRKRKVQ